MQQDVSDWPLAVCCTGACHRHSCDCSSSIVSCSCLPLGFLLQGRNYRLGWFIAMILARVCREQLARLSVHVEIASKINTIIEAKDLTDLGKLEQDLVFGDATSKEIITYISTNQKMSAEDKVCDIGIIKWLAC